MLDEKLFYFDYEVDDKESLLKTIGQDLIDKDYVKSSYIDAILDREANFPTGLPTKHGVAIPHTSTEYANTNKLVFVKLKDPVVFNEMGNDENPVDISLVIFIIVNDGEDHMRTLTSIIGIIQDEALLDSVVESKNVDEFRKVIMDVFEDELEVA